MKLKLGLTLSTMVLNQQVGDPPTGFSLSDSSHPENAALGEVVGTLSATDPDGGTVLFSIPDETVPFAISGNSLIVAGVLDFETKTSWTFNVQAMGSRGGATLNEVTITVTDVSESPPSEPPPSDPPVEEDGDFTVPTTVTEVDGAVKIHGKKAPGSIGKFIVQFPDIAANSIVTLHWTLDASLMSLQGRKVMAGFVFLNGIDFHLVGPQGDGTASGAALKTIYGDDKWNSQSGLTELSDGAPLHGNQYDMWLQIEADASGDTYTIRSATDPTNQDDFDDEFTGREALPFSTVVAADKFGFGALFQADDTGVYSFAIDYYREDEFVGGDPNWANVVFLGDFDGVDEQTTYTEKSNAARALTIDTVHAGKLDSAQVEYGTTSLTCFNGFAAATVPDSTDWDLSAANSDQFTIEYSYYQPETTGNYSIWNTLFGGGNFGILARHNAGNYEFFWSNDGSSLSSLVATGAITGTANAWHKWCVEKDGTGKLRIYKDGAMIASSTPANSAFFATTGTPNINAPHAGQSGWLDNLRITKGVARYASDSGYTPATAAFPIG